MGYTHYFSQRRDIGRAAWSTIAADLQAIISHAENVQGVALRDWSGEGVTRPHVGPERVDFNGAGDDAHESFVVNRIRPPLESWESGPRGRSFCKTARKPYDIGVTACLCYLATVAGTHDVSSDGRGADFLAGLELARQALPRYANVLDIPRGVLEADRWCAPWPHVVAAGLDFRFCVDGRAYIMGSGGKSYRFHSHYEAAQWAASWTEKPITVDGWRGRTREGGGALFAPFGSFNEKRNRALARQQAAALRFMLDRATGDRALPPPAFVRPGELPAIAEPLAYTLADLLKAAA